ncbi:MAG: hypothetical protein KDI36_20200, partial [Pseudomonadales bacterium]|nr:hypothetical protein [Pseudomonadales bacterium]
LATAYTMAMEYDKAIDAWRDAAKFSDAGELDYRLAQALANQDRHKEAIAAYEKALDKGLDEKYIADANFWLGISLMQIEQWDNAKEEFRLATKEKQWEKSARQYMKYVDGEKRRQAALKEMIEGA